MKQPIRLYFLLLALLLSAVALANPITWEQAQQNALSFLQEKGKSITISSLRHAQLRSESTAPESYYVFNIGNNDGYVIAAGDDCAPAILGYAESGYIDMDSMPANMKEWLEEYAQQIQYMQNGYSPSKAPTLTSSYSAISPLLTTTWGQRDPYNQNCPDFFSYGKSVTGCVATAMAQVMYYHRANSVAQTTAQIPAYDCRTLWLNGSDTLGHIHVEAIPAGSPIDWDSMLDSYSGSTTTNQQQAVANLMKYCGAAVQMDYSNNTSYAYSSDVPTALKTYFNYSNETVLKNRSDYSSNDAWESLIYNELSNSRPVYYSGRNSSGGHAFVCDGYDGSGYYHINWGWSGTSDGFFLLTALDPYEQGTGGTSSGYNQNQAALIYAEPKILATSISLNKTSTEMSTGSTMQLTATVVPSNATNKTVTWTTSNSSVATVSSNGLVTAQSPGTVTITARTTDGSNLTASCSITVNPILATTISLNKTSAELTEGNTMQLTATVLPSNATNKTVTWSTSNSSVATVSSSGLVTAKTVGSASITARTTDGTNLSASCSVTIKQNTQGTIISFADANVKAICVQNWDTNGDGELSTTEAAKVTNLNYVFREKSSITSFNELAYFTNLKHISDRAFFCCYSLTSVTIPNSVTSIDYCAFSSCRELTSLIIPNSVTSIGESAFSSSGLINITIPNSVNAIGESAFLNCSGLTSVNIGNSVTSIGSAAFNHCTGLISMTVASDNPKFDSRNNCNAIIETASNMLIAGCSNTIIPNSVTSLGSGAFWGRSGLTHIAIPKSVISIASNVFGGCTGLISMTVASDNPKFDSRNNCNAIIETASNILISGCKNTIIPNTVTSIGDDAFAICSNLTSINIPNSVTSIGSDAFFQCSGLTDVTIGNSVTSIGNYAFYDCSGLTNVTCLATTPPTVGDSHTFYGVTGRATLYVPVGTKSIYQNATYWKDFYRISELSVLATSITLNKTSAELAVGNTMQLTATVLPSNATNKTVTWTTSNSSVATVSSNGLVTAQSPGTATITARTTDGSNLTASCSITVKQNTVLATSITLNKTSAELTEGNTMQLTATVQPSNTTNKTVTWSTSNSSVATVNSNGLVTAKAVGSASITARTTDGTNLSASCSITVKQNTQGTIISFADANVKALCVQNWDTNGDGELSFEEAQSVTALGTVFKSNNSISSFNELRYFTGLTSIGSSAFRDCIGLTSITIPEGVASIGYNAFYYCIGLTSITIPSSVTSIGESAFYCCRSLTSITIPEGVTSIGKGAFSSCSGLTSITIPSSVTGIGQDAFRGCSGLTSITVDTNNTVYDSRNNCNAIIKKSNNQLVVGCKNTIIPTTVTSIGYNAFYYCIGLTSITIPSSVTSIGKGAFSSCSGLTSITIPSSVTSIGQDAFRSCSGLTSITVDTNNTVYDSRNNCNAIIKKSNNQLVVGCKNTIIPTTVTSIGNYAFYGCSGLISITIPEGVTSIGNHAFTHCIGLTSITIPSSVTSIGHYAFYGCSSLTSITIPEGVTSIGDYAFSYCGELNEVYCYISHPSQISMGSAAFYRSPGNYASRTLHVPAGSLAAYQADTKWSSHFGSIVEMDPILATSIELNETSAEMLKGETMKLTATIQPSNATNNSATWTTSNSSVAIVDSDGLVTALTVGTATITVTTTDDSNLSASCMVTVKEDLSNYDNYLFVEDTTVMHGETIVIPVKMTNNASIISFQTDIFLPEGLELMQEDGEYMIDPSPRMTRTHSIMSNDVSNGAIRVICYSSNYKPFTGNSGDDLFYLTLKVADDAEGDYIIQLKNTLLTKTDFVDIAAPDVAANVNVKSYLLGDANNSGTVTVTDVVVTAQYVLERNPQPFVFEAADVNFDNNITVADVSRIAWMVLNPTLNAPLRAPVQWKNCDCMSGEDITLTPGETCKVSIILDNEADYAAFQLDLQLPSGLTASNFQLTDRAGSHAFNINTLQNGNVRALCYSPNMTAINGHEGALLTFDVTAATAIDGVINVEGIELVTTECQTVRLDAFTISVNHPSGFNEVVAGKTVAKVEYFNLAGQQIEQPESGVTLVVTTYTDGTRSTSKVIR